MFERFHRIPALSPGTGAISAYDRRRGYQYLWFGRMDGADKTPLLWRVLSKQGNQGSYRTSDGEPFQGDPLLLLSEYLLGTHPLSGTIQRDSYVYFSRGARPSHAPDNPASVWHGSDARQWCGRFEDACFPAEEDAAILSTWKSDGAYHAKRDAYDPTLPAYPAAADILNGDRVFFLSAEEAENESYGFLMRRSYTAEQEWWTRTYQNFYASGPYAQVLIVMTRYGGLLPSPATENMKFYARPALNLDPDRVLFSSIGNSKAPSMPQETAHLAPVPKTKNAKGLIWKLTLRDDGRNAFSVGTPRRAGNTLRIPYENAVVYDPERAPNERISAAVTDAVGTVLRYYGNIALPTATRGTARLVLPELNAGDRLFVFCEQCNGPRRTDHSSRLIEIALP